MSVVGQLLAALTYYYTMYSDLGRAPKLRGLSADVGGTPPEKELSAISRPTTSPGNHSQEILASSEQKFPLTGLFSEDIDTEGDAQNGRVLNANDVVVPAAQDIEDALVAARRTYDNTLKTGDSVVGGYMVDEVFTQSLEGLSLKAVVMSKGKTRIVSYMMQPPKDFLTSLVKTPEVLSAEQITLQYFGEAPEMKVWKWLNEALNKLDIITKVGFWRDTWGVSKVVFTGHSMGGALAQLLALQVRDRFPDFWRNKHHCIMSFGSPRVGDHRFAEEFDHQIAPWRNLRFVYRDDVIPMMPLQTMGYQHAGVEIWIRKKGISRELKLKYRVCPRECSGRSQRAPQAQDHKTNRYMTALNNLLTSSVKVKKLREDLKNSF